MQTSAGRLSPQQRQQLEQQAVRNAFMAGNCKTFHEELRSSLWTALSPAQQRQAPLAEVSNLELPAGVPQAFALPDQSSAGSTMHAQNHPNVHTGRPSSEPGGFRRQLEVSIDAAQPPAARSNEPSPTSVPGSTPSSGRPTSASRFHSANEDTGFESASDGHQILSDDERAAPSADISKTSLTAGASESSYSTSSLRPFQKVPSKRAEVADELSTPFTPIAEGHGSMGNDEADERQLSESTSSGGGQHRRRPAGNLAHSRRPYLDEAALRASLREALAKGHSRPNTPIRPQPPGDHWMSQAALPAQAREHARLFDTGYLNSDGTASEGDAEAYESESESEADGLDDLAQQLQVGQMTHMLCQFLLDLDLKVYLEIKRFRRAILAVLTVLV